MKGRFYTPFVLAGDPMLENEERRAEIYRQVFSTVNGRMVLADILVRAGIGRPAYEPGQTNPSDAVFYSGMHAKALEIARTAGLELGSLGRALTEGELETMMEKHDDDGNDDAGNDDPDLGD